jgi:hypothetical protein
VQKIPFFFRFMNDSLDVGTCRYLPLIESTSCFRLPETVDRESSMAARAAVNSRMVVHSSRTWLWKDARDSGATHSLKLLHF